MSDPILEAAARALAECGFYDNEAIAAAQTMLAAVTPLTRAQVLEEAAKRLLELAREERILDGATINRAAEYLNTLRILKEQP